MVPLTDVLGQPRLTKSGLIPSLPPSLGLLAPAAPQSITGQVGYGAGLQITPPASPWGLLGAGASGQRYTSAVPGLGRANAGCVPGPP